MDILKGNFKQFRKDLAEAVKDLEAQYDIKMSIGGITYEPDGSAFTSRLTVKNNTVDGKDFEQAKFEKVCALYGFKPSDYNREFTLQGERFTFVGINSRAPKNCCKIKSVTSGSAYKCSEDVLKRCLNNE